MDNLALAMQGFAVLLTLAGIVYGVIALWAAKDFDRATRNIPSGIHAAAPPVSVLKPVRGLDPRMYAGLLSHCTQQYGGDYELLFGVSSLDDPAIAEIARLRVENPAVNIRIVECPERLGSNGKVSNLAQMLPYARHEHVIVNDSDILISPQYLTRVMAAFADPDVGLVTVPYRGRTERGVWSRLEGLGISTEFFQAY